MTSAARCGAGRTRERARRFPAPELPPADSCHEPGMFARVSTCIKRFAACLIDQPFFNNHRARPRVGNGREINMGPQVST